jgi:hypothetical protein
MVLRINEAFGSAQDLQELLGLIHRELGKLVHAPNFYISLYDQETDLYSFPYLVDEYDQDILPTRSEMGKSLTDFVRRSGEPLLADEETHKYLIEQGEASFLLTAGLARGPCFASTCPVSRVTPRR